MRLINCFVRNFGSYEQLSFTYADLGLALVSGQTGSGKSTLADIAPWILLGITSKEGAVDDIRKWGSDKPAFGSMTVETPTGDVEVTRVRGSASENDLYWTEGALNYEELPKHRGKDLTETQKLLNKRLGLDPDLYLLTSYFSQFSKMDDFFTSRPKDRRDTLERLADLSLPVSIAEATSEARKAAKKQLDSLELTLARLEGKYESLKAQGQDASNKAKSWEIGNQRLLGSLQNSYDNFEVDKQKKLKMLYASTAVALEQQNIKIDRLIKEIEELQAYGEMEDLYGRLNEVKSAYNEISKSRCTECGGPKGHAQRDAYASDIKDITARIAKQDGITAQLKAKREQLEEANKPCSPYDGEMRAVRDSVNNYGDRLEAAKAEKNPYIDLTIDTQLEALSADIKLKAAEIDALKLRISNLTQVYDLSFELRGALLESAISSIQEATNAALDKYFDSEIKCTFTLEGSDKLNVGLQKNGYDCNFKQLSGGQRRMLTLSFAVSVMAAAANKAGMHMNTLTFDEALDGLDDSAKVKAFRMFQDLSKDHEGVLLIDHCEDLKQLFDKRFEVTMSGDKSLINEQS